MNRPIPPIRLSIDEDEPEDTNDNEPSRVVLHICTDGGITASESYGITYRKCGGGRQVIRKQIGGN